MKLRLKQTVIHLHFQKTYVLSEAKCSLSLVAAFCVHSVECVEEVRGLGECDIYRAGEGSFCLFDRMTRRILTMR